MPTPIKFNLTKPPPLKFGFDATISVINGTPYDGAYNVTPKISTAVVLGTKNKVCKDDITVLKTPQYEVSNAAGGLTLIMGDEYMTGVI